MRWLGKAALAIGLVLLAGAGGLAILERRLDADTVRRALIANVQRQTGRAMTIGRLEVSLLPWPRIEAHDLAVANEAGAADPQMLRVGHMGAHIALLPLLRHVIRLNELTLDRVMLHIERQADGNGNWQSPGRAEPAGGSAAGGQHARWGVEWNVVRVSNAQLFLNDGLLHRSGDFDLKAFVASGLEGEHPHFSVAGEHGGAIYQVHGALGPLRRLSGGTGGSARRPWPFSLQAVETVEGSVVARIRLAGSLLRPEQGAGYDLDWTASIARLTELDRLFPHARLPSVQGVEASGHVTDANGHPCPTALHMQAGPTVLGAALLQGWSLAADSVSAPLQVAARGSWHGQPVFLRGNVASLGALSRIAASGAQAPLHATVGVGNSAWRIDGSAGADASDLRVQGVVPSLPALIGGAPDIGRTSVDGHVQTDHLTQLRIPEFQLVSEAGDLGGAFELTWEGGPAAGRPAIRGQLRSARLDIDRLIGQAGPVPAAPAQTPPVPPEPQPRPAAVPRPLAFGWTILRSGDADIAAHVSDLLAGGSHYQDFVTHFVLRDGRLLVDPLTANGPAGAVTGRLQADAGAPLPSVSVWMHPLMLPGSVLSKMLEQPGLLRGMVELAGEVHASGSNREALVRSVEGHAGLSMTDALLANAALRGAFGHIRELAPIVREGGGGRGETQIRCLGLHAQFAGGQARMDMAALRSERLSIDGHGQIALADGALDLHLVPAIQIGGAWASLPVSLRGTWSDPRAALDPSTTGRYQLSIGGPAAGTASGDCASLLQNAREGLPGSLPAAIPDMVSPHRRKAPKTIDILRGLGIFR